MKQTRNGSAKTSKIKNQACNQGKSDQLEEMPVKILIRPQLKRPAQKARVK
ncbi:MAG: hypothetical protein IT342_09550 [Candidatus Melainabacteria bacterium]|nr:hypothetical protein [Candidatus Melainabacteria bacterium]